MIGIVLRFEGLRPTILTDGKQGDAFSAAFYTVC